MGVGSDIAELDPVAGQLTLAERTFDGFPGAALLVERDGRGKGLNASGQALLAESAPAAWDQFAKQVAAVLKRGDAAVEMLSLDPTAEAVIVPLADGTALVLLRKQMLEASLRGALIESRQRFKALVEISSDFAWETDAEGVLVFVSPQGALGWSAAALLGRHAREFLVDPTDFQAQVFRTEKPIADMDVWFRRADGGAACLGIAAVPVLDANGAHKGARGVCRDLTADRARDQALARARLRDRLMAHIVRTMRDEIEPARALSAAVSAVGLAVGAAGGAVLRRRADGGAEEAARWGEAAPQAVLDTAAARLSAAEEEVDAIQDGCCFTGLATRYRGAANGALMLWRVQADGPFSEPDRAVIADVADHLGIAIAQVGHHESIVQLSRIDPLTGLLNRRAFQEELERRLATTETADRPGALLYLDLDNFKQLNDTDGHGAGDEALQAFAQILRENTRSADLVARLGGDEFIVWMQGINAVVAETRARAILRAFGVLTPRIGSAEHPLSVSMGLALYDPQSGESPAALIVRADEAMYAAKEAGKGQLRFAAAHAIDGRALSA
ncbi:MAG TPA: sensor domain-containing diguanylate cyclase [Stellaceae bacterium]|nr:sensor domain-containing diguanylate cyclase [Stellaceae bacterium]